MRVGRPRVQLIKVKTSLLKALAKKSADGMTLVSQRTHQIAA